MWLLAMGGGRVPAASAVLESFGTKVSPENILGLYAVAMEEVTRLELSLPRTTCSFLTVFVIALPW